ncbi:hypothetical protein SAQ01S_31840 [Sphingomonas aquatilis NBRC 16722]|uniref:AcrR family transcriptional regulator n=1 Tax=Sphingomonas aquatilis TaxID=93063 RepID=A0AAW3TQT5_9SPHN|nr:TetR/AcrR family transcriptional regulator [Sphingomonas aquatilis]MBB3874989.1 AcrR family transcriptional regulator [Sphingomonas aquatilis]GEM73418.1 hypothetical protein SAQ01S_31840 [Sphingomonas aquatilis NBRC 16722]
MARRNGRSGIARDHVMDYASPMTPEAKRGSYHHGSLREALLLAADGIIREKGHENFSLREAARRAGVSPGAPKHHFGSVEDLLGEVATKGFDALAAHLEGVPLTGCVSGDIRALVLAFVRFAIDQPELYKLMARMHGQRAGDPLKAAARRSLERMGRLMGSYAGLEIPAELPSDVPPEVVGSLALAHGLAHLALDHGVGPEDFEEDRPAIMGNSVRTLVALSWPDETVRSVEAAEPIGNTR